jgi:hypothetical protein
MSAYLGNAISIWLVAYLINKELQMTTVLQETLRLNVFESMGLGMMASLLNLIPLYICFKIDIMMAKREDEKVL